MKSLTWLKVWIALVSVALLSVSVFNYLVNPYGVINWFPRDPVVDNTGLPVRFKLPIVERGEFNSVMIGSSRTGVLDPQVVDEILGNTKTFNLAMPGSTVQEQFDILMYALGKQSVHTIIYGLDLGSFNENRELNTYYLDNQDAIKTGDSVDNWRYLFSKIITEKSIEAMGILVGGEKPWINHYAVNGMRHYDKRINDKSFDLEKRIKAEIWFYFFKKDGVYSNFKLSESYLSKIEELVRFTKANHIRLYLFIPPVMDRHFETMIESGLIAEYEKLMRKLVEITPIVDFNGRNSVTKNHANYWDSSHLRKELTGVLMKKLLVGLDSEPYDFGRLVTTDSVELHIEALRLAPRSDDAGLVARSR